MSYAEHHDRAQAERDTPIRCAVVTVSDTRTEEDDTGGALIRERVESAGHEVVSYEIVPDEPAVITDLAKTLAAQVEVALFSGGTGITRRDRTYEALSSVIEKPLPGFGELFRMLSYEEIGSGAMLSRAVAGVYRETLFFAVPGSPNAVKLAMDKLIVPELKHLVWEIARQRA